MYLPLPMQFIRRCHPYERKSASQAVLSRMQLTLHATRQTPRGASRLVLAISAWSVKTRRALRQHCRDARVYGHTTTVGHAWWVHPPNTLKARLSSRQWLIAFCAAVRYQEKPYPTNPRLTFTSWDHIVISSPGRVVCSYYSGVLLTIDFHHVCLTSIRVCAASRSLLKQLQKQKENPGK